MAGNGTLREYHAAVWDEPVIMEMGYPGRRGMVFPDIEDEVRAAVGDAEALVPEEMRRRPCRTCRSSPNPKSSGTTSISPRRPWA